MNHFVIQSDSDNVVTVVFDLPGKVNIMNGDFMSAMEHVMASLEATRSNIRGVILTSAKSTFFAGGDLALMQRAKPGDESFLTEHFNNLKGFFRRLEKLGVPTVAAINGTALGGGYELCLSCHHRIAVINARAQIGLPEVDFGILPAAGGVVRLTKLLGPARAAPYLLTGKRVDAAMALRSGLIHETADSVDEMLRKAKLWILSSHDAKQPWELLDKGGTSHVSSADDDTVSAITLAHQAESETNPALAEILSVMKTALRSDFDEALALETDGFVRLVLSANSKKRIADFFAANRAKSAVAV